MGVDGWPIKMGMGVPAFSIYVLVLSLGWIYLYGHYQKDPMAGEIRALERTALERQVASERLARIVAEERMLEFRVEVARILPSVLKDKGEGERGFPLRDLASVLQGSDSNEIHQVVVQSMFERAQNLFKNRQYARANTILRKIVEDYSYSIYVPRSYFLLAEGLFQQSEFENFTGVVESMIKLFPSHELTGFILIRLGNLYEMERRFEDAVDLYRKVLRSYPYRDVASQAKESLQGIESL